MSKFTPTFTCCPAVTCGRWFADGTKRNHCCHWAANTATCLKRKLSQVYKERTRFTQSSKLQTQKCSQPKPPLFKLPHYLTSCLSPITVSCTLKLNLIWTNCQLPLKLDQWDRPMLHFHASWTQRNAIIALYKQWSQSERTGSRQYLQSKQMCAGFMYIPASLSSEHSCSSAVCYIPSLSTSNIWASPLNTAYWLHTTAMPRNTVGPQFTNWSQHIFGFYMPLSTTCFPQWLYFCLEHMPFYSSMLLHLWMVNFFLFET